MHSSLHRPNPQRHRHTRVCLCLVLLLLVATACGRHEEVHFARFERLLFATEPARLQEQLLLHRAEFDSPLLNLAPNDPRYMQAVEAFVADPAMQYAYHVTDSLYADLGDIERQLGRALARATRLCPSMQYDHFYTLVTGDYGDYTNRVFCNENSLCISLDHYAVAHMQRYGSFGVPLYMQRLLTPEHIVPDCLAAMARAHIALPEGDLTLLDYAVAEGKALYFLEQVLPSAHDTLRLRYTREQLDWMRQNTENVWGWMVQNRALFSTDLGAVRNLVDEGPHTNTFGQGSAPRTAAYIGLQIVRAYMKKSHSSIDELFQLTDSRQVLDQSAWRP